MLNPLKFISKFIKSSNQKELDRISKIVSQVNLLEGDIKKLKDEEFPEKTRKLKEKIQGGLSLDEILPNKLTDAEICIALSSGFLVPSLLVPIGPDAEST